MPNAYAEPKRMTLGLCDLYIDDVFVGNMKGAVTFQYTPTFAFQRPGNVLGDVKGERTSEQAMITAEICDLKLAQLRRVFGVNASVTTGARTVRKSQVVQLPSTTNVTLTETVTAGTAKVATLDRKTDLVSSTDYSMTATTIARKSGGAIVSGDYVIVEYDFSDAGAKYLAVGGEITTPNTFRLDCVHQLSNGKRLQITFYKAMTTTDFSLAFNEKSGGDYSTHNVVFKALVDITKPEGSNMFEVVEEDSTT